MKHECNNSKARLKITGVRIEIRMMSFVQFLENDALRNSILRQEKNDWVSLVSQEVDIYLCQKSGYRQLERQRGGLLYRSSGIGQTGEW
jgi:hypothetical protein